MSQGIRSVSLPVVQAVDDILGNWQGRTVRLNMTSLAALIAARTGPSYQSRTGLYADLDWPADTIAVVLSDPNESLRGQYKKNGAAGTGSWTRVGPVPISTVSQAILDQLDDPQRLIPGVFLNDAYYERDGLNLYIKPQPFEGGANVAYVRGGFLPDASFTYAQIKSDLSAMPTPSGCALGVTSPLGETDCIRLYLASALYYVPDQGAWEWDIRKPNQTGKVKVVENNYTQVGDCLERPVILSKLLQRELAGLDIGSAVAATGSEHLTPIISAASVAPNIDTVANTLTFTIDTLIMHQNVAYRIDATTALNLSSVASSTKVVYMDRRNKSLILRAYNSAISDEEKRNFVLVAMLRYTASSINMAISCEYTINGNVPGIGADDLQTQWAAIFTPLGGNPTPTTNLPEYKVATRTLTFYPDTILVSANKRWIIGGGASIAISTASSAWRIFWDTTTDTLIAKPWSTNLTAAEAAKFVLVATIRDGSAASVPPVISMMVPYTVDGLLFGYIPEYATSGAENRAGAALEGIHHRGFSAIAPENTLAAYKASAAARNYVVEGDLHWTSDSVAMLLHDATIDRTSDGTGVLSGMTSAAAKAFDYGTWKGAQFAGEPIPTFDEFLVLAKKLDLFGYFEIKEDITTAQAQALIASVKRAGMRGRIQFDSFYFTALQKIVAADPTQDVGYLVGGLDDATWTAAIAAAVNNFQTGSNRVAIEPPITNMTTARVEEAHDADLRVVVYTINSEAEVITLGDFGVDGIMTDALNIAQVLRDAEL